jgi:hypothetical protein
MTSRLLLVYPLALLLGAWMAPAAAQLSAEVVGNRARVCMNASDYDGNLSLVSGGSVSSATETTVITFNPDGGVTSYGSILQIFHGAIGTGATPAVEIEFTCSGTYTPIPPRTISVVGTCIGTALNGPAAGQQTETSNLRVEYEFLDRNTTLVSKETEPTLETVRNLTTGAVSERICHRAAARFVTRWGQ